MHIDYRAVQAQLREETGDDTIKVKKGEPCRHQLGLVFRDNETIVYLNPAKIRSDNTYQEVLNRCRQALIMG
jgi:hypothetical protein